MDDEDDRQLLDILGDVDALNDYLHGSNGKSIDEDDVTNAAYGSDGSFFSTDTALSNPGLKDGLCADFSVDSGSALPLSSSLSFIEDELGSEDSPSNDDQPFDILQKSLLEADITEQTLAQEALLDAQPAPTLVQAPVSFPSIVPGNIGGTVNVVTPAGQFIQGVSQLPNGSAQHIQVLGSFGTTSGGVMTLSNLERTPQIVLRPPLAASTTQAQGFKNIPLQNIIIQRGPGGTQALVRPIQPKPLQTGAQTVYSVGLQPASTGNAANVANASGQYTANGSIVVQSSLEQGNASAGQFILPGSLAITPATSIQNGPTDANANTIITTQNAVQIVAGQSFTTAGQLILNQRVVNEAVTQTRSNASPGPVQGRITLVAGQTQVPGCPVQRLLVTQTTNCTSLSPLPQASAVMQEQDYRQGCSSPALKVSTIHATKPITQDSTLNPQVVSQLRPALAPLTRGGMILQQVRKDHVGVLTPDKTRFTSFENVLQKLLPYNVFQGAPPSPDEFTQVDDEFELVASQVLTKTHAMISKYRKLLMVEAERSSPSSEIVMIDRTFNQEERGTLTQEKRMVMVDPDGFLEDFCCGVKSSHWSEPSPPPASIPDPSEGYSHSDTRSPDYPDSPASFRTELRPPYGDPGGGYAQKHHKHNLKRTQQQIYSNSSLTQASPYTAGHYQTTHSNQTTFTSPPHTDTDTALEAAVNSILEC